MIIRKTSELVKIKIGGLVVNVSPLTRYQKAIVTKHISSGDVESVLEGSALALKYSIKSIEGLKNVDGSKYELELDENGLLSDSSLDDLLNAEISDEIQIIAGCMVNKIPSEFIDPDTGEKVKGISLVKGKSSGKK